MKLIKMGRNQNVDLPRGDDKEDMKRKPATRASPPRDPTSTTPNPPAARLPPRLAMELTLSFSIPTLEPSHLTEEGDRERAFPAAMCCLHPSSSWCPPASCFELRRCAASSPPPVHQPAWRCSGGEPRRRGKSARAGERRGKMKSGSGLGEERRKRNQS